MGRFVPLSIPNFEGNERKYVDDALDQGWVSTGGAYITELEEKLAEFLQVKKTAAVQSGTSALHLSLIACGVQPGDMVIVPTLTFIAAVNPVRYQFAEPVFMDCDDSLCMDPQKLRRFCENECVTEDGQLKHKSYRKNRKSHRSCACVWKYGRYGSHHGYRTGVSPESDRGCDRSTRHTIYEGALCRKICRNYWPFWGVFF